VSDDFEIGKGEMFGDWLHERLSEEIHFEEEPSWMDRVSRIEARLQEGRDAAERLKVEVPWIEEVTAFTGPGRYIYLSRRLMEQFCDDEPVALIIAHEIAHHDLEHVTVFRGWSLTLKRVPGALLFGLAFHALERRLYGPEKECSADRHGMELCLTAGYDGHRCLRLFDILEDRALYLGDLDIVYGPDVESDDELSPDAGWKTKTRIWAWQRTRGYLPIRDRRKALLDYLARRGSASAPERPTS